MNNLLIILVVVLFVGYLIYVNFFASAQTSRSSIRKAVFDYKSKEYLMTPSENEFFKTLVEVADDRYYVFPQIRLSTLLDEKIKPQNWKAALHHINQKSVDYVLCDKITLKPVYAVELDDASHETVTRQVRDTEVERIFQAAGLPLVRFSNFRKLSNDDIAQRFLDAHNLAEAN